MTPLELEVRSLRRSVRLLTTGFVVVCSLVLMAAMQDSEPRDAEFGVITAKEVRLIDERSDIATRLLPWHWIMDTQERLDELVHDRVTTTEHGVFGLRIRSKEGNNIGLRSARFGGDSFQALDFWDESSGPDSHSIGLQVWHYEDEVPGQVEVKLHSSKQAIEEVGTKATIDGKAIEVK